MAQSDGDVSGDEWWFRCPNGHLGRIDADQAEGEVSIICDTCEFHGYVDDGEVV